MKKIILGIILCFILIPSVYSAEKKGGDFCPIRSNTHESITSYIDNVRKVVINVNNVLAESEPSSSQFDNTVNDIGRIFGKMVSWDGYFTDYQYYIYTPLTKTIPYEIKRDLSVLENETKGLEKFYTGLVKKGYSDIKVSSQQACKNVKNCDLSGTAGGIISQVIQNNIELTVLYKQIVNNPSQKHSADIKLSEKSNIDFIDDLMKNYGKNALESCDSGEGSFKEKVFDGINKITQNFNKGEEHTKSWKVAWTLLVGGSDTTKYRDKEEELLKKELSRQGLSTKAQETMLKNLEKFNDPSVSFTENNFLTNSFKQVSDAIENVGNAFGDATDNLFGEDDTLEQNKKNIVGVEKFLTENENTLITNQIKNRLNIQYSILNNSAAQKNFEAEKVIGKVIEIHQNIENGKKTLQQSCEIAVRVCSEKQGKGLGYCGSCK